MILWATGITGGFQQGSDLPFIKVTPTAVVGRADLFILVERGGGRVEISTYLLNINIINIINIIIINIIIISMFIINIYYSILSHL